MAGGIMLGRVSSGEKEEGMSGRKGQNLCGEGGCCGKGDGECLWG